MLFAAVPPAPTGWSFSIGITMILCNVFAIFLWKSVVPLINSWLDNLGYEERAAYAVPEGAEGMSFNFGLVELSLPELLGATSLGHVFGAATILGLTQLGAL
ncbi:hypothetical protein [Synechococcus sp. PCC 7336]|uniref:hypothetical protein n=1 Tax=Synechococcus sp. PCC 7336 TaxID=195250 RepID=UPI000344E1BB|nr:hypothetical protein [Synechococcus sp. PCC 7336]